MQWNWYTNDDDRLERRSRLSFRKNTKNSLIINLAATPVAARTNVLISLSFYLFIYLAPDDASVDDDDDDDSSWWYYLIQYSTHRKVSRVSLSSLQKRTGLQGCEAVELQLDVASLRFTCLQAAGSRVLPSTNKILPVPSFFFLSVLSLSLLSSHY